MLKMAKKIAKSVLCALPLRNIILFESCPDLSDNTKPVFDELIRRGVNEKYKMIWICYDEEPRDYPKIKNTYYVSAKKKKAYWYAYTSRVAICCNRFWPAARKDQKRFYLMHGSPMKDVSWYYTCPNRINYMITASEYMNSKCAKYFKFDENRCIPLGYPRNDMLFLPKLNLTRFFGKFDKYIIWYPTVKQFKNGKKFAVKPLSFFDSKENIEAINEELSKRNILLIIKPHFAQLANMQTMDMTNVRFINDQFYVDHQIIPYNFLASCDALLTDYSSVFFDYMLCDKPIGLVWDDIDAYEKEVGLVDFYEEVTACCSRIYTVEDLTSFFDDICSGRDPNKFERERVCGMVNYSKRNDNAERVVDFIMKEM